MEVFITPETITSSHDASKIEAFRWSLPEKRLKLVRRDGKCLSDRKAPRHVAADSKSAAAA